ncbi:MAG: hypothetical protein LBT76_04865 [Tannerella sp.]|jgi:uncharacterized iron-regulated protein|nr:hypothetical protein [Tannerella sp.]
MKKYFRNVLTALAAVWLSASFTACEKDNGGDEGNEDNDALYASILENYVSTTVVPTYKALAEAALEMRTANAALKSSPSDATMATAAAAWMKARIEWEKSEAFLFGPVGEQALDIDGHIDSWPLELNDIQAVLQDGAQGLTGQKAWRMEPEVIGFHVTEYLLYREGKPRLYTDLSEAERDYLTAATDALVWDCVLAYVAWVGESSVPATMQTVFRENPDVVAHLEDNPNYKNFAGRLTSAAGYSSYANALREISGGAADIAGEVGATKIESPYSGQKVEEVESWYSWHSLDDYQNNILSIKNAYLGGLDNQSRQTVTLSAYIAGVNPALDSQVKAKIEDCLTKIAAIGTGGKSFYEVVRDQINAAQVDAAVTACGDLERLFGQVSETIE